MNLKANVILAVIPALALSLCALALADQDDLVWSTFLGGAGNEESWGCIGTDGSGNVYVAGLTRSVDFPTTDGAYDTTLGGSSDAFIAKLDPDGSDLEYSTLIGGGDSEYIEGLFVTGDGIVYASGGTNSDDFPVTAGAFDTTFGGNWDAFVLKLNSLGSDLVFSTYLGGSDSSDYSSDVAVDGSGYVYVSGTTSSSGFPVTAYAFDTTWSNQDGFVAKLNPTASGLIYSTFVGGSGEEWLGAIALDDSGHVYATGATSSDDFPTTSGAFDTIFDGRQDVFITKLNPTGSALVYSTYLGGEGEGTPQFFWEVGNDIAVDVLGNAYVTGYTCAFNFPVTPGAFDTTGHTMPGYFDAFVTKLNPEGSDLMYSTYLGASGDDHGASIAVDGSGHAYVIGVTSSSGFPTTPGAYDTTYNGNGDIFVIQFNAAGSGLLYSTFFGGHSWDGDLEAHYMDGGIVLAGPATAYVMGETWSDDFPTTPGVFDATYNDSVDVFVAKLVLNGGAVAGAVSSAFKGPVAGAVVTAQGPETQRDTTDALGQYLIADLPVGQYSIMATATGFHPQVQAGVEVASGDSAVVDFSLEPYTMNFAWSTFLGGSADDYGRGMAVDSSGCAYVVGHTSSADFPVTAGAYDSVVAGQDVFVAKLNALGSGLLYATYLGGTSAEYGEDIALDGAGNAYLTGYTLSADFPATAGAYDVTLGGTADNFVAKLSVGGDSLIYATYLGGSGYDYGQGIAVDDSGCAHVTGGTPSGDFPVTPGAFDISYNGGVADVFVVKLNAAGSALRYGTYVGGSGDDRGYDIEIHPYGYPICPVWVTGVTASADFPTSAGAFDSTYNGGSADVFLFSLNAAGSGMFCGTYLGGSNGEAGHSLVVDICGWICLAGETYSADFPVTPGAFDVTLDGSTDAFVARLVGSTLEYATFLGGSGDESAYGIGADDNSDVYVTGFTKSSDFPATAGAIDNSYNGNEDVFVAWLDDMGDTLHYATFLGGSYYDWGQGLALDSGGDVYVVGSTKSAGFPTTAGAFDTIYNGGQRDAFVFKLGSSVDFFPPDPVDDLSIALESGAKSSTGNMYLWWSEPYDDVGVTRYVVYRSTDPATNGDSLAGTADTSYLDVGAAGTVGTDYFYVVKAVDATNKESMPSNKVGEFDRATINGTK